jgi:hypothetical protein
MYQNFNQKLLLDSNEFDVVPASMLTNDSLTENNLGSNELVPVTDLSDPVNNPAPSVNNNSTQLVDYIQGVVSEMSNATLTQPVGTTSDNNLNQSVNNAVTQIGGALGTQAGTILGNLLNSAVQGLGNGVQETAGGTGATIVSSTLREWFKRNWYYVTGGVIAFFFGIWYFVKRGKKSSYKRK